MTKTLAVMFIAGAGVAALTAAPASASVESAPGRCTSPVLIRTAASTGGMGKGICQPTHTTTANCKVNGPLVVVGGVATSIWYYITDHTISVSGYVSAAYYETDDWAVPYC